MVWLWLFSESLCWSPGTRLPLKERASLEGFQISPPRDTNHHHHQDIAGVGNVPGNPP